LVLKCYPRTTKGAVGVKPNSSELSYLLFYAQSRRTKIQKVCSFLEKKTASDVYRLRIGYVPRRRGVCFVDVLTMGLSCSNVQVTLQILTAMIEKAPKDMPLIGPCVLKILDQVLRSNDITMVESSVPTFDTFCEQHDAPSLLADQTYLRQYETVVRQYATLASTRWSPGKVQPSKPVSMRWRNTGLEAIRSVASSDALSSVTGRLYEVIVPMTLENLWTDNEAFLDVLLHRAEAEEKVESGALLKRRTSVATVRTADTTGDTNPIALSGTAVDVDKLAEEDIGVLAIQCLKQTFVVPNRAQIRAATLALLDFIKDRVNDNEKIVQTNNNTGKDSGWAVKMYGLISRWAPVQYRYTILATTMDSFTKIPMVDDNLQQHIVLAAMIGSLLQSDVNLIGLSVMDVLLGLISQIKRLVQMPGDPNSMRTEPPPPGQPDPRSPTTIQFTEKADKIIAQRKELLNRLQHCIGDLATHVYYADQISDMILTLLVKLKHSRASSTASSSPHGEKAETNGNASTPAPEDVQLDSLFSLTVAKTAALKSIKAILQVANPRSKMTGNVNLSRNRVPIEVWEGTHWLLRDPDGLVRKAYADAVLTWLDRETTRTDLRAKDETTGYQRSVAKSRDGPGTAMARRAVSSASAREKPAKSRRSHFLMLLHLAIYDNSIQYLDYETDMVILHCLLSKLVNQLGVNAVRYGLPMVFRLQEDIQDAETPVAKVRLGSLCHGYFWILTEKFDFENSVVGRAIQNEIIRRRTKNFWVEGIHVPPPIMELVGTPGVARPQPRMPLKEVESEALLPFDDRISLVEAICASYQEFTFSPPVSPTASPGRTFTQPFLGTSVSSASNPTIETRQELPIYIRESMVTEWSREAVIAAVQAESKSASLNGSRSGTTGTNLHPLNGANGHSSLHGASLTNLRPSSSPAAGANLMPLPKVRKSSARSHVSAAQDTASSRSAANGGGFVTSVDQLKLILSGQIQPPPPTAGYQEEDDNSDDSMVSYEMTASEMSFIPGSILPAQQAERVPAIVTEDTSRLTRSRSTSRDRGGPLTSHPTHDSDSDEGLGDDAELVPPVPPLPSGIEGRTVVTPQEPPSHPPPPPPAAHSAPRPSTAKRSIKSRAGENMITQSWIIGDDSLAPAKDLQSLLEGIDSRPKETSLGSFSKPPY
jgi:hypothetical protein